MANSLDEARQEGLNQRAKMLRDEVDKLIARQEFIEGGKTLAQHAQDYQNEVGKLREQVIADKAKDFQTTLNDAFTDAIAYGTGAVRINPSTLSGDTVPGITHAQWLEQTQNMRVVALNEACGIAKAMIEDSNGVTPEYIAKMAHTFATFLTEGRA